MNGQSFDEKIIRLNQMIKQASRIVFLGGAGVSTESGIPDFRSAKGLYHQKSELPSREPEYMLSNDCLQKHPEEFFAYYRKHLDARSAQPNAAHRKLAEMEKAGKLEGIITQNIDGLHQKAGSRKVIEIHGSTLQNVCVSCHKTFEKDFIFDSKESVPRCTFCGRMVRPDVVLYGELLPECYNEAIALVQSADLLIIGGTSLAVGSAAQLAYIYRGLHLVIINMGQTSMDHRADLVFHDAIGTIMQEIDVHHTA